MDKNNHMGNPYSVTATTPTLTEFEDFLDMKASAAQQIYGPAIANVARWGNPRTDGRWTDDEWVGGTHMIMWNRVLRSEAFARWRNVLIPEGFPGRTETIEVIVSNLIRKAATFTSARRRNWASSSLPGWKAFSRKKTLARACFLFIQTISHGSAVPATMTTRGFYALRDMIAVPNGLAPILRPRLPLPRVVGTPDTVGNKWKVKAGLELNGFRRPIIAGASRISSDNTNLLANDRQDTE